ncbi:MAG: nucleotide pyrophosphohydrolase [Alphaproteobacteria bacterium]|nr:nucleotide pyrophosphohydrolase [Alphaproteobacteria bacterium]
MGLVGEIGSVVGTIKKRLRSSGRYPGFNQELSEELGDALWYLASVASNNDLRLEDIAEANLQKAGSYFDPGVIPTFDLRFADDESLPRKFSVEFCEREVGRSVQVLMKMNDVIIGDHLTDNSYDPDGYRYHDAFHLAYAAVLGWSPVMRAILRRKRKSDPVKDEVDDGARAAIIEEAVSIYVFNEAKKRDLFGDSNSIDFGLLKIVQGLTSELEVKDCTSRQWKQSIIKGYEMFRKLKEHRGGTLNVSLDDATITFQPPA